MLGKTGIWFVVTAMTAILSFAAVQGLPEGEGKKLVEERCTLCHGVDPITSAKLDRDGWKNMVQRMVGYGSQMNDKEVDVVVDYLSKNFAAAPSPAAPNSADEKTALRYINGVCSSCHDADLIKGTAATKEEWLDITNRMNGKGAGLSEQDVTLLVNYLAQKYPKKE